ncbi:nuclear transport factor 2 family protein [uncultured Ramlibacter sp.]|uniref:nuclear transport factor 2 family protein n=1 Tax=uncultured Ramlibacter sp. TaxID=260755 RepID=UPI0026041ED8|nr:nuclear transport factor 2 family protein [uncultured Ramlibacter sp.]
MGKPTEIAKQAYAAFAQKNMPALFALLAEDVEWQHMALPETGTPYGGTYKGKPQVAWFYAKLAESLEIIEFEPREYLEGPNHVTIIGRSKARALPDGAVHETAWVQVAVLDSDSKIIRWIGTEDSAARFDISRYFR